MSATGTAIVDKPAGGDAPGAVAKIKLYGPKGGEIGSAFVGADNAREMVARLQRLADAPTDLETLQHQTRELADALLTLWAIEGDECQHGTGLAADCYAECEHEEIRPALRLAARITA